MPSSTSARMAAATMPPTIRRGTMAGGPSKINLLRRPRFSINALQMQRDRSSGAELWERSPKRQNLCFEPVNLRGVGRVAPRAPNIKTVPKPCLTRFSSDVAMRTNALGPSRGARGATRPTEQFMEITQAYKIVYWDHEPDWSTGLRPGPLRASVAYEPGRRPALRFMERVARIDHSSAKPKTNE